MIASVSKINLVFKSPAGTSRGILNTKTSWFLSLSQEDNPEIRGIGEIAPIPGLSVDNLDEIETEISRIAFQINNSGIILKSTFPAFPSIQFGLETALKDLEAKGSKILFPSTFTSGKKSIPINGLVWMGDEGYMMDQVEAKIKTGFKCLKLKIGAIDFDAELKIIQSIRNRFTEKELELRVDANGAFSPDGAEKKLMQLSELGIHSIEQPIKQGQWKKMSELCSLAILPIALDEELIGISGYKKKKQLLKEIGPPYIILKPTLLGGFRASEEWIALAEELGIGWWITSALESNIGLNAIAQWTATLNSEMYQGLGTGALYTNNINCPLVLNGDRLFYTPKGNWDLTTI